jgi:hypothetical protein
LIQLLRFAFCDGIPQIALFIILLILYLIPTVVSVIYAINLLIPKEVAFTHQPGYFFEEIRDQYVDAGITDEEELDLYIKTTYYLELEEAVDSNNKLSNRKSYFYNQAFRFGLLAIVPYIICVTFYITKHKDENPSVDIQNYREIIRLQDSLAHVRNSK